MERSLEGAERLPQMLDSDKRKDSFCLKSCKAHNARRAKLVIRQCHSAALFTDGLKIIS